MMSGYLFVDDVDVYTTYGVYVEGTSWCALVAWAPLKDPESNDWHEEDGVEEDLSAPVLDTREVTLTFAYNAGVSNFVAFVEAITDGAVHTFDAQYIGRTYKLRLVKCSSLSGLPEVMGKAEMVFADDYPLYDYVSTSPTTSITQSTDYLLDGVALSAYGARVLEGTLSEVVKVAAVKENMTRDVAILSGVEYDDEVVTHEAKDVDVSMLFRADSLTELWTNYDTLLYTLVQPDVRLLYVEALGAAYECRYVKQSVSSFFPDGKIWLVCSVRLLFTGGVEYDAWDGTAGDLRLTDAGVLRLTAQGDLRVTY